MRGTNHQPRIATIAAALLAGVLAGGMGIATAGEIEVHLSGKQEVPPVETAASGHGVIKVEDDKSIRGSVKTSGIQGSGGHVHEAPVGKNGPDIITLKKTGDDEWSIPGGATLTDAQYDAFKAGGLYINIHSDAHKGGEIRGQLKR
ncbi:CHRD domain-containing protein [Nitrosovibrio sp. Nv17]|uniref:CHRD domain-containing protein n=1 Tax=Nitrosovibrio sp. Nv17 TaxID=1855339 RepID=UPI000908BA7E|nr:CHRD domain-containing protein [Nitrosovibrio sp. Nv17]SFW32708.1 CHRD domain-containing protein [Nitrosovibrio sp. Nv17]